MRDIRLRGRTLSGRVEELDLISDRELVIPAKDFRLMMGPNLIRSTNFKVCRKDNYLLFTGKGWGHGVGMCQWGAYFLGSKGYKAERILKYYYPGTKLGRI